MWVLNRKTVGALCLALLVSGSGLLAVQSVAATPPRVLHEHHKTGSDSIRIAVLSSRNDVVSGGTALISIDSQLVDPDRLAITLNKVDARQYFNHRDGSGRISGVLAGLKNGPNVLKVSDGRRDSASLTITNWPISGPIISGAHEVPFICMTNEFALPATTETLGPPLDGNCSVATRIDYVYYSTQGLFKPYPVRGAKPADIANTRGYRSAQVPFVVRVETGVINRGIYQIAMLHDPTQAAVSPFGRPLGWNGALLYQFGGGCEGGMYIQGKSTAGVLDAKILGRGFAMASSSLNVYANNCDDLLASETMMMVKEHFVKSFGAPTHTLGWGCSGGSYQAEQIADNYPGLLDGIVVGCSFPDVGHAAVTVNSFGARLVYEFYSKLAHLPWSKEQIVAVSGLADFLSLETAGKRNSRIDPTSKCSASIAPNLLYEATSNPTGARCSIYDHGATGFGRDPKTGFGRRPLDNVGVQFGLGALNAGAISIAQFIELNQLIGGLDIDAKRTPARSTGDRVALRRGYQTGRFLFGGAGLAQIPVIDYRAYVDFKNGDNHQRFHSFSIRARMLAANGDIANHVMLTESDKYGLFSLESPHLEEALEQMDAWVSNIAADSTPGSAHQRVARARPLGLVDACFTQDDKKISEQQVYGRATHCNALYPPHSNPHIVAGESIANNVVKCSLKALDLSDYTVRLNAAELLALKSVFVDGVCDYKKPGIEQQPLIGTWVSFGPA